MPSLAKISVVALSIGSCTAAGCVGGIYLTSGTPIKDLINEEYEYILLDTTGDKDSASWSANWTSYKTNNATKNTNEDAFQLDGWTKGSQEDLISKLKTKCQQLSNSKISNKQNSLYSKVTSYCGRRVTIADEIGKLQLVVLNTETSDGAHGTIWDKRVKEKDSLQSYLTTLKVDDSNVNKATIKTKCNEAKSKNKDENDYQNTLNAYKKVCTKQNDE